jgi:Retinal pigment epithelial membrane protein
MTTSFPNLPKSIMNSNTAEQDFDSLPLAVISGNLPTDLTGHMFVVAPAGTNDHPFGSGTPLLNGTGKVYRFDFNKKAAEPAIGKAFLSAKLTKTPCYYADQITIEAADYDEGDSLLTQLQEEIFRFRDFGLARVSPRLGLYNQINTGLQPFRFADDTHDRLVVTWDVGRPYEIDPFSLKLRTPIGRLDDWIAPDDLSVWPFPFIFSTAHPVFDPVTRRDFYTVQYAGLSESSLNLIHFHSSPKIQAEMESELRKINNLENATLPENSQELFKSIFKNIGRDAKRTIDRLKESVDHIVDVMEKNMGAKERLDNLANRSEPLETDGDFYGLRKDDSTYIIRWDGSKDVQKWQVEYTDGTEIKPLKIKQTIHQMGLSADYIVLIDTAFKLGFEGVFLNPPWLAKKIRQWFGEPQLSYTNLYIISRKELTVDTNTVVAKHLQIPRETGHYLVNYDNPNDQITLNVAHMCASDSAEWLREFDKPILPIDIDGFNGTLAGGPTDINYAGRYVIDVKNGTVVNGGGEGERVSSPQTWGLALCTASGTFAAQWDGSAPRSIDDLYWIAWGCTNLQTEFVASLYEDYPHRTVPFEEVLKLASDPANNPEARPSLFRVKTKPDAELQIADDFYSFPVRHTVNSPQFIPRAGGTGSSTDGYIVCIVVSDAPTPEISTGDEIWVFQADNLQAGPICKLANPQLNFGFTLHTAWMQHVQPVDVAQLANIIPVREDFANRVADKSATIKNLFEEIYKNFE